MLDFDAGKLLIIGVVALIVIGPKDLPRVLRQVGQAVAKVKRMASEFQGQFMDAMREADLEAIREDLKKATADADLDARFDPARDLQRELTASVAADGASAIPSPGTEPVMTALEPTVPSSTEGFALPSAEPGGTGVATLADAGAVPIANLGAEPTAEAPDVPPTGAGTPARKRRIRVRRRTSPGSRVHAVLDRTGVALSAPGRVFARDTLLREARPQEAHL